MDFPALLEKRGLLTPLNLSLYLATYSCEAKEFVQQAAGQIPWLMEGPT
jgi:hypothetical protein